MKKAFAIVGVLALAGCSTLPHDTTPQVLRTYQPVESEQPVVGPLSGQEPDLLLREFYAASAIPSGNYSAARAFLAPAVRDSWEPKGATLLVDSIDLTTVFESSSANSRSFTVRGNIIGSLEEGGAYAPQNAAYEARIRMDKVDGEWRVADLPQGVVIERTELRNKYQPQNLYFYEATGSSLIADRRWIYAGENLLHTELVTMIMQGPSNQIAPAVNNLVPHGALFAGLDEGVYRFTGMSSMDEKARTRFAAQLVWTLSNAGVPGPYSATADGAPLIPGLPSMTTDDFAEYNPRIAADSVPALYAVSDGHIELVSASDVKPINNILGHSNDVNSAEISGSGTVAAVRRVGEEESRLFIGEVDGAVNGSVQAKSISQPTFEHDRDAAWVVVDGTKVIRVVHSSEKDRLVETEVNMSELDDVAGEISVLRLSPTGARLAMIIGGKVYTAVATREPNGVTKIVNVREMATELGGTALAVDWQPDGSLVVGTSTPGAPIWRLEQDGSSVTTLPAGNITAPVVAIAASPSTLYATDAHSMLQFPLQDTDAIFWREVPGIQGLRAAPIVAD